MHVAIVQQPGGGWTVQPESADQQFVPTLGAAFALTASFREHAGEPLPTQSVQWLDGVRRTIDERGSLVRD